MQIHPWLRVAAVVLGLMLPRASAATPLNTPTEQQIAVEVVRLTNIERVSRGLSPVSEAPDLDLAAYHHSVEMGDLHYFAHNSPDPNQHSVKERVRSVGGTDTALGENLSRLAGYSSERVAQVSVQGWMQSPEHRVNMLDPDFNRIGVSVTIRDRETLVTQVFSVHCVDLGEVLTRPHGGIEVVGQVVSGPHQLGLFFKGAFVGEFNTAADGRFDIDLPDCRDGELGLGQPQSMEADGTSFRIVAVYDGTVNRNGLGYQLVSAVR